MLNTRSDKMNQLIQRSKEILDALLQMSNNVLAAAEGADWPQFMQLTEKRTLLMTEFEKTHRLFTENFSGKIADAEKSELNLEINEKIKIITKVDSKILDIVSREKEKISQKVNLANQGKSFLKNYQKRINSQSTVYQTM